MGISRQLQFAIPLSAEKTDPLLLFPRIHRFAHQRVRRKFQQVRKSLLRTLDGTDMRMGLLASAWIPGTEAALTQCLHSILDICYFESDVS